MIYPDTSFLCALYVQQSSSSLAVAFAGQLSHPLECSSLLFFEFRQSVQFQVFRYSKDRTQGYSMGFAQTALKALQSDLKSGFYRPAAIEWAEVHQIAERLAFQYTAKTGHRSFDILHLATALHLGASQFLTFDNNQKKLAETEGLIVPV